MNVKMHIPLIFLLVIFISSCVPETPDPPPGVWKSTEPHIVLYLLFDYQHPQRRREYLGIYTINGNNIKIFAVFGNGLQFRLYKDTALREDGGISGSGRLIAGTYRVINDQIHYRPSPFFQEELGVEIIIFNRIEDYAPIDPTEWFPNWNPKPGSDWS